MESHPFNDRFHNWFVTPLSHRRSNPISRCSCARQCHSDPEQIVVSPCDIISLQNVAFFRPLNRIKATLPTPIFLIECRFSSYTSPAQHVVIDRRRRYHGNKTYFGTLQTIQHVLFPFVSNFDSLTEDECIKVVYGIRIAFLQRLLDFRSPCEPCVDNYCSDIGPTPTHYYVTH